MDSQQLLSRFEDAIDAFTMIFNGGQYWLLGWTIGNMFSISIFNYSGDLTHKYVQTLAYFLPPEISKHSGITVTKHMSATTRTVLDQIRVILIWAVFLIPWVSTVQYSTVQYSEVQYSAVGIVNMRKYIFIIFAE